MFYGSFSGQCSCLFEVISNQVHHIVHVILYYCPNATIPDLLSKNVFCRTLQDGTLFLSSIVVFLVSHPSDTELY
jgi:hypothetical protein